MSQPALARDGMIAFTAGIVLGTAAGLLGVGGGEFRVPVLLYLLALEVKTAAGVNLMVGFATVTVGFLRRWDQQAWPPEDVILAGILIAASLAGSITGARQAHRLPSPPLKRIVLVYLVVVGLWMIIEAMLHLEIVSLNLQGTARWIAAAGIGFVIAAISSSLGVAGGEMRIPALMYLFGYGVKEAGTISLLASIPTVGAGALTYRRLGHIPNRAVVVALFMVAGSLAGVVLGALALPLVNRHVLKGLLGTLLLGAAACLALPVFFRGTVGGGDGGGDTPDRAAPLSRG